MIQTVHLNYFVLTNHVIHLILNFHTINLIPIVVTHLMSPRSLLFIPLQFMIIGQHFNLSSKFPTTH